MNNSSKINSSNNMFDETQFNFYNNDDNDDNNDKKNYNQQIENLNKNNKLIPNNYNLPYEKMYTATPGLFGQRHTPDYNNIQNKKNDKYDHLGDYYYKKGDRNYSSITRSYTHYVNIDSRLRNMTPVYNNLDYVKLRENPLQISFDSNELFIKTNDLIKFNINDKISLTGLYNSSKNIKVDNNFFEFANNSYYVKVNYPHTLYFNNLEHAKSYLNTDLYVEFADIISNINSEGNFINNTPTNILELIHKVYLYNPDTNDYSNDYFFIKLFRPYNEQSYNNFTFTFKLIYLYNYGIANNKINSQYPINSFNYQGYLLVKKVKPDGVVVELNKKANFKYLELGNIINYGGNNIHIAKINELIRGYPIPNEYYVELDRTFNNVIMIKLISSEFPVLNNLVYDNINNDQLYANNKLYWQNYDEQNIIYSISINQGNYTMQQLITLIENKVQEVERVFDPETFESYNKKNIIKIEYYERNNEIKFHSYKEAILVRPFRYAIIIDQLTGEFKIQIKHINHKLIQSDKITISNAVRYEMFSETVLNNTYYIDEIIDNDNYYILLKNINVDVATTPINSENGGNAVKITVDNIFRLRFDYNDTLGSFFGFRNLGEKKSVTRFASNISNKYLYQGEILDQSLIRISENNEPLLRTIFLDIQNYIYMTCDTKNVPTEIINQMIAFSKIKNVFSKIQIQSDTAIVYNSFTCNASYIHNPITELKDLHFKFYDKYGNLLNYYDFDHSFTLEITTLGEIPEGTNLSLKFPKVN